MSDYRYLQRGRTSDRTVAVTTQSIQQLAHHLLGCREHKNGKVGNMAVFPVTSAKEGEA